MSNLNKSFFINKKIDIQPMINKKIDIQPMINEKIDPPESSKEAVAMIELRANDIEKKVAKGRVPTCVSCGKAGVRNDRYDAYYCEDCNAWIEPACSDPTCQYCNNRPNKPNDM